MNDAQQKPRRAGFWNRITVAQRIFLLVLVPLLLLFLIGSGSIFALNQNQQAIREIRDRVVAIDMGNNLLNGIQSEFEILLHEVSSGRRTWAEGLEHLTRLKTLLEQDIFPRYRAAKAGRDNEQREQDFRQLLTVLDQGIKRLQAEDRSALALYLLNDLEADYGPVRDHFASGVQEDIQQVYQTFDVASLEARNFLIEAFVLIVAGMMLVALLGYLIYRSISSQVTHLTGTIRDIAAGDLNARVQLAGHNELVELGDAFDGMVEERIATQKKINADHQRLNNSVFALLEAVADLSEKNLTVRATVTEDATGPLADAINQLAEDTGDVLGEVRTIALSVESAANDVNQHALSVRELAALERTEAQETLDQMGVILRRLDSIAASARQADTMAASTGATLREAQQSVSRTLDSMSGIRETARVTGKRLKRLGERTQEISRIIDIIGNIAERTTVLALNASMQANAAGEAGRGFSLIAEEIQHLSENARESTDQINVLVRNIQQEANTTITTMDETIAEVVEGSARAEEAAQQMETTLEATGQLVHSVGQIASDSGQQVAVSRELQSRAGRILEATEKTGSELSSLTRLTRQMAEYGQQLVRSVSVFRLEP